MPWARTLEQIGAATGQLIKAAEEYLEEIEIAYEAAKNRDHSDKTMHIWKWQVEAAEAFCDVATDMVHAEFIRMVEQDYILRRSDVDDILV